MSKGRGSLYRIEGSPYWYMSYQGMKDGRWQQIRRSTKCERKGDAQRVLNQLMAREHRIVGTVTLEEGVELLREHYERRGRRSWRRAEQLSRHLLAHFGEDRKLSEIRRTDLKGFIAARQGRASNAEVNREVALLRTILNLAADDELIESAPSFRQLALPEPPKEEVATYISPEALEELVTAFPAHLELVVRFLYLSGVRANDGLRLEWSGVDFDGGTVTVRVQKTDKILPLPMIEPMREVLLQARKHAAGLGKIHERVFLDQRGTPVSYYQLRRAWLEHVGNRPRVHDLRVSCSSNIERAGVPTLSGNEWTGHSSMAVRDRYVSDTLSAVGEQYGAWLKEQNIKVSANKG